MEKKKLMKPGIVLKCEGKKKNHDSILESKSKSKTEKINIHQWLSLNINYNEPNDEEIKKTIES